jgi:alcohol dehydrogenase class IV
MAFASLSGGLALANARLGAVHGLAGPLGGALGLPHGAACAALLAPVVAANVAALRRREPESPVLARYAEIASILGGKLAGTGAARPEDASRELAELASGLDVRKLGALGLKPGDIPDIITKAQASSSMRGNPIALDADELGTILESAR